MSHFVVANPLILSAADRVHWVEGAGYENNPLRRYRSLATSFTKAQSRKDFAAKMAISSKEARETHYWLRLIRDSQLCMNIDVGPLIEDCEELIRMLTAIVKTAQKSC
jgi:hypothetical protein